LVRVRTPVMSRRSRPSSTVSSTAVRATPSPRWSTSSVSR
jgi:hypothetical protein